MNAPRNNSSTPWPSNVASLQKRALMCVVLGTCILTPWIARGANDLVIQNQTYEAGQNATVIAGATISANTAVMVESAAKLTYFAGSRVTLGDGFRATSGCTFHVYVGDADADSMPDAWEVAVLGSTSASPTGHADGDSLTNLLEFFLGTDPTVTNAEDTSNQSNMKVHRPLETAEP